jgi:hypothetical protein
VLDLLHAQVREAGAACLLVTHSQAAAARADRVLRLTPTGVLHLNELTRVKTPARAIALECRMPITLYDQDGHRCLMFTDLTEEGGEAVQSNQFLIVDGDTGAVIDPGGNLAYSELYLAMTRTSRPASCRR